jgi:hypothetical protein
MKDVILIEVESIQDLEPDSNFIMKDTLTGKVYLGNGTSIPDEIVTTANPILYANIFMFE